MNSRLGGDFRTGGSTLPQEHYPHIFPPHIWRVKTKNRLRVCHTSTVLTMENTARRDRGTLAPRLNVVLSHGGLHSRTALWRVGGPPKQTEKKTVLFWRPGVKIEMTRKQKLDSTALSVSRRTQLTTLKRKKANPKIKLVCEYRLAVSL